MDIPILIPNGTHQMIIQLPNITNQVNIPAPDLTASFYLPLALVLATFGLVGVTWYWNWKTHNITRESNKQLKQSNDLLITELESKYRPIISRYVYDKRVYHPSQINDEACSITPEKIMFHVINTGTLPAKEMSYEYYIERRDQLSKTIKLSPTGLHESTPISSLAPTEYYSIDIPFIKIGTFETIRSGVECYFGFIIWYSDENGRRYYYHMEGFFQRSALMLNHVDMGKI